MKSPSSSHSAERCHPNTGRSQPEGSSPPKRILLVSRNVRLLAALTRRLCRVGHRVCSITSEAEGPAVWSRRLYDVVVFSADPRSAKLGRVCQAAKKADSKLVLVMLADKPFGAACETPNAIITEKHEPGIAEKLLAIVSGSGAEVA